MLSWLFGKKNKLSELPNEYKNSIDRDALDVLTKIQRAGFKAYLVGGCVRDILLGKIPKDFDIATNATPQQVKRAVRRSFIIGRRFRIVVAKRDWPQAAQELTKNEMFPVLLERPIEKEYQITTYRRKPELDDEGKINENVYGTIEQDAGRRDFTVNAFYLDPFRGEILDPVGGMKDLRTGTLRMIGKPKERFEEDPIRIFRALRFCKKLGLKLGQEEQEALVHTLGSLKNAKRERIREELLKIMREGCAHEVTLDFQERGLWKVAFPVLGDLYSHHKKTFQATLDVTRALDENPWCHVQAPQVLYYLWMAPILFLHGDKVLVEKVFEELKIFKNEAEVLLRIHTGVQKMLKDSTATQIQKIFLRNPKYTNLQVATAYALSTLAHAWGGAYLKAWKAWEPAYKAHLDWVMKEQRKERYRHFHKWRK